uniref:Uncharacterized protein n=1 Tax=Phlebotomus papatasi TaxID=29031 RepID=A0A1B0DJ18_PHLPP
MTRSNHLFVYRCQIGLLNLWRKYRLVVIFPSLTAYAIYADLAHTRKWKLQQKQLEVSRGVFEAE